MERRKFISSMGLLGIGFKGLQHIPEEIAGERRPLHRGESLAGGLIILSVKIIKAGPGPGTGAPHIEFLAPDTAWSSDVRVDKYGSQPNKYGELSGENRWEIYFNIQTSTPKFKQERLKIVAPGIEAARVIIGHTDVAFEQTADEITFELVDDRSMGQYIKSGQYQNPLGGYPIGFIHNWEIRKAGKYALEQFPQKQFRAVPNYLLAAQEVLRQMGNMGPGAPKPFEGNISLLGSEVASSRGHMDYPPHVHIMLYEFQKGKQGDFGHMLSRLAPHFYMDEEGCIVRNHYSRIVGTQGSESGEYGIGDVVHLVDSKGNRALALTVEEGGSLLLGSPDGRRFRLCPDPEGGPSVGVNGYFNDKMICRARVRDYPDLGIFRLRLEVFAEGQPPQVINDGYLYDPFTGNRYKKLYR